MKFKTHNDQKINIGGTYLQGRIEASYSKLRRVFGKPANGDIWDTDAEWDIKFKDGTVAAIYNWQNGVKYNGKKGTPTKDIREWNIGGHNEKAVERVKEALGQI